jgi:hypothetical protein
MYVYVYIYIYYLYMYSFFVLLSYPSQVLNSGLGPNGKQKGELIISSTSTFRKGLNEGIILRDDIYILLPWKQVFLYSFFFFYFYFLFLFFNYFCWLFVLLVLPSYPKRLKRTCSGSIRQIQRKKCECVRNNRQ